MADLRAEQIMDAVKTELDGATPAGSSVYRGRVDPIPEHEFADVNGDASVFAVIGLQQSGDEPLGERGRSNLSVMDSVLELKIEAGVIVDGSNDVEPQLNAIRKAIHSTLMAENALSSLRSAGVVVDIIPGGADEPVILGEQEDRSGTLVVLFAVHYRHSVTDASA